MKFHLLDRIEHADGGRVVATKAVTLAEEYLADHFPTFPVLPGVLMLEACVQASAWALHLGSDFAHSIVVLKEAKNVRYGRFVAPGQVLRVDVRRVKADEPVFQATGTVEEEQAFAARLEMAYFSLASSRPAMSATDERLIGYHRRRWDVLRGVADGTTGVESGATTNDVATL